MTSLTLDTPPVAASVPPLAVAAGRNLIAAGSIFGLANVAEWAILSGTLPVHPALLGLTWPVAVIAFIVILRRLRATGGAATARAVGWSRASILLQLGIAMALAVASGVTGHWALMMWMSPIGLSVYAVGWLIASRRGGTLWMSGVGLGAAAAAGGVALLVGTPVQYLAYAMGLFAFVLVPGIVLALGRTR
ncbi:hypothetical protein BZG35_03255 [Brevundimonas sp. LM2]|uniref:hypothetical protein n=1 Tax=Brevundimonas sp. LM2 TaxID=1938605 RepID=UPI000983B304|nr:hypothetical protein [Brevundimonas sp. LM2]AQR60776.1 hypothetical protein BZG35_03255 [Brevundimonas sp. LM2]